MARTTPHSDPKSGRDSLVLSKDMFLISVNAAFDPQSRFIKIWHQVLLCCILYELFTIPFMVVFESEFSSSGAPELVVFGLCEALFVIDFYVRLNTGFFEDGNIHRERREARRKYVLSWQFVLDFVAVLPLSLVTKGSLTTTRMAFEFHKFLRLWRIPSYLTNLDDIYAKHFEALKLLKLLVATIFLSHFVACVRFSFGYDEAHDDEWLPKPPAQKPPSSSKYLMSLFWAFGIMTGLFEGELPHTVTEFAFTMVVAMCGFSLFISLCATFFMMSKCESGQTEAAEARINQLKHVLTFHNVPDNLKTQAIEYLRRYYTDAESNDREATKMLCPSIAQDIQVELLQPTIARIPLFSHCSKQFIVALTSLLELISLPSHCTLFEEGEPGDAMYVVHSGVLDVIVHSAKVRELRKGDFVGELSLFSSRPRSATVLTITYCILYKLSRFHTDKVLAGYPTFAAIIKEAVDAILQMPSDLQSGPPDNTPKSRLSERQKSVFTSLLVERKSRDDSRSMSIFRKLSAFAPPLEPSKDPGPPQLAAKGKKQRSTLALTRSGFFARVRPTSVVATSSQSMRLRRSLTRRRKGTESIRVFYDQYVHGSTDDNDHAWWASLLLRECVDADSTVRLWWLVVLQLNLAYNWIIVPLQLAFVLFDRPSWYIFAANVVADLVLLGDIYLNFSLSFTIDAEKILSPERSAVRYLRGRFLIDLLCALPCQFFSKDVRPRALLRIPRLLRLWLLPRHIREFDRIYHLNSKRKLVLFGLLLIMLFHIVACLYFSITNVEGFSPHETAWLPSQDVYLVPLNETHFVDHNGTTYEDGDNMVTLIAAAQYFRSLYYATNVLTGLGRTIEPDTGNQYFIALVFMFSGFFITAIVVDNVQKRFTASAFEQKEFFATRSRIQLFLRRQNAPFSIHHRVNSFLDYWWASHRGAVIHELLIELPLAYKREILRSICKPALQTMALLVGVRPHWNKLEESFVDHAKFELYGQGELIYRQGDNAVGLYFLLEGSVSMQVDGVSVRDVPRGGFFGSRALQLEETSTGYAESVVATSGCVVLCFTRSRLAILHATFPGLASAIGVLEKRFLENKLAKFSATVHAGHLVRAKTGRVVPGGIWQWVHTCGNTCFDPDSSIMLVWETWLFVTMTVQWILVMMHICFGVNSEHHTGVDVITVLLETSFVVDLYIRTRLGFHEFGNKVMDPLLVRRHYLRSSDFVIDLVALLPLYMINWTLADARFEILNINKLLRLLKVPQQFRALENRYLKLTTELRLFKLVYYTFLLSHIFGCIWFDFASHASLVYSLSTGNEGSNFGHHHTDWLPPAELATATLSFQYFASLFWAFGLMSASSPGELPKSPIQCFFSVVTMTCGFFLFAYVVGNFTDVLELVDAENREFNAKLGSMRHLLAYFTLPPSIETKLKTYYFFKRFHTITQERLLERCLPPSLLTDVRLIHLNPMIDKVPFLGGMDEVVTRLLVAQFNQVLILKQQFVYKYGDEGSDMFFVFTGILEVCLPSANTTKRFDNKGRARTLAATRMSYSHMKEVAHLKKVNEITAGDFFGENALFSDAPRNAFVRARTSCILYQLSRQSLEMIFELYPEWKKRVLQTVKVQQKQQRMNGPNIDRTREPSSWADEQDESVDSAGQSATFDTRRVQPAPPLVSTSRAFTLSRRGSGDLEIVRPPVVRVATSRRGWTRHLPRVLIVLFEGTEAQSMFHLRWLKLITICTLYVAVVVPYRISLDPCDRWHGVPVMVKLLEHCCEILFVIDVWVNLHIKESEMSLEYYDQKLRTRYQRERLVWDVVAALPIDYVLSSLDGASWYRLSRCVKLRNIVHYMNEINRRSVSYEWNRLQTMWILYVLAIYWSACAYLAIATYDGYGDESQWNEWPPTTAVEISDPDNPATKQLLLRLFRGLFFGVTSFVKKGRTFVPRSTANDVFSVVVCFAGLLVMAFMIGEIASLYISFIGNEVNFRKHHISVELYLARSKVSSELKQRVHLFLSTLWASHSGISFQSVFEELPGNLRTETILYVVSRPLACFMDHHFRPCAYIADDGALQTLAALIASQLRFDNYPRGERVLSEGMVTNTMYFVVKGQLITSSANPIAPLVRFGKGDFFGAKGVLAYPVSHMTIRAVNACDLLALRADALARALRSHHFFALLLLITEELIYEAKSLRRERQAHNSDLAPVPPLVREEWARLLQSILRRRRNEWGRTLPDAPAMVNSSSSSPSQPTKDSHVWHHVLADALDLDAPLRCLDFFVPLLELCVPEDAMFDKTVTRAVDQTAATAVRPSLMAVTVSKLRMRDLMRKVTPMSSTDPASGAGVAIPGAVD